MKLFVVFVLFFSISLKATQTLKCDQVLDAFSKAREAFGGLSFEKDAFLEKLRQVVEVFPNEIDPGLAKIKLADIGKKDRAFSLSKAHLGEKERAATQSQLKNSLWFLRANLEFSPPALSSTQDYYLALEDWSQIKTFLEPFEEKTKASETNSNLRAGALVAGLFFWPVGLVVGGYAGYRAFFALTVEMENWLESVNQSLITPSSIDARNGDGYHILLKSSDALFWMYFTMVSGKPLLLAHSTEPKEIKK